MLHPALRGPRVGFAVVLLLVFLGSASGAPAPGLTASIEQPAPEQSAFTPRPADSPALVTAGIPCIYGTCQVQIHAAAAPAPTDPLPSRTPSAPQALAQR